MRRVIVLLVLAVVAVAACTPVKPARPVPGRSVAYYYVNDFALAPPMDAFRSVTPFSKVVDGGAGTARQTLNSEGQVFLEVINAFCCAASSGFYTPLIPLGSLDNFVVRIVPGGTDVLVSLVIDVSGNGEWGEWDANGQRISLGGDDLGQGDFTQGGQIVVDDNREFFLEEANAVVTLGELKAGAEPGIGANTPVGILVETIPSPFFGGGDAASIVAQVIVNGIQVLP